MQPARGSFVNTLPGEASIQPVTLDVSVLLSQAVPPASLGAAPYNPFLIANQDRSVEIHLPDHIPTDLADQSRLGKWSDDSDPKKGRYFKTKDNLLWGLNLAGTIDFRYPSEYTEIVDAYLDFAAWAQSDGQSNRDWYVQGQGQTNEANIY